jgi:hypothetical protein
VRRVVLVGNKISPGNPVKKPDGTVARTLWGELAWQLGGREAYEEIRADDERVTSPGDRLRELFKRYGPCLILIDEWVAYARQLHDQNDLPGGSFETQFTFAQTLTESAKLAGNCLAVISLPASDTSGSPHIQANNAEVGGVRGREALDRLRNVIGRLESSWRPATAEESFEIVRRRLFEPLAGAEAYKQRDVTARAMVVTGSIERAIQYFHAIRDYLAERKSPYRAIVAFSGEHEYGGVKVTEANLNGFPSNQIADKIREDPYRFLICADKFQTGYDEPLLHTMYVDKALSGVKAVQTLSRLNRAHPQKHDTFVLDFVNDPDTIRKAFEPYYRTTILADETDPNKLHDLKADLDSYQVYAPEQVNELVRLYLGGADRDQLDPILDACVANYIEQLDEDGQVDFKGNAKAFLRTYSFLSSILPFANTEWEKLSIFLEFLVPKLPAPKEEDLSRGILEAIDMDSYRVEKQASIRIALPDADAEIEPVPTAGGGHKPEPELDRLSNIIKAFNDQFGNIPWTDADRVRKLITEEIPARVAADSAYQNARKFSDKQNARIEHDKALVRVMTALLQDDTELFKQFSDNDSFRRWLTDTVFALTYGEGRSV